MKINRLKKLANYLLNPGRTIELFGMYDADNLGDEAMKIAGLVSLPRNKTVPVVGSGNSLLKAAIRRRRFRDIVVGGGTLIHGGRADGRNSWLEHVELRHRQGARVSFLGTGISFLEEQITAPSDSVVRWSEIMKRAAHVGLRGPLSQATAARLGVSASIFGDAAFLLYDAALAENWQAGHARGQQFFGINVGEVLKGEAQARFESSFAELLVHLSGRFRLRLFVVNPEDYEACLRVAQQSGLSQDRYEIVCNYRDAQLFMRQAAECVGFIGIRLHASGLAMAAGIPALLVAYLPKCRDFVLPIELEHALLELPLNTEGLLAAADDLLARPAHYRNAKAVAAVSKAQYDTIKRLFG